jgi:hypothetical protein
MNNLFEMALLENRMMCLSTLATEKYEICLHSMRAGTDTGAMQIAATLHIRVIPRICVTSVTYLSYVFDTFIR